MLVVDSCMKVGAPTQPQEASLWKGSHTFSLEGVAFRGRTMPAHVPTPGALTWCNSQSDAYGCSAADTGVPVASSRALAAVTRPPGRAAGIHTWTAPASRRPCAAVGMPPTSASA
eukprot:364441-Chlamydomonas_euryale.AAC.6